MAKIISELEAEIAVVEEKIKNCLRSVLRFGSKLTKSKIVKFWSWHGKSNLPEKLKRSVS